MASTTLLVRAVPWSKSMAGLVTAAAMSGFEARWMTVSWPSIAARSALDVADLALDRGEAGIVVVGGVVPAPARRVVVVEGDRGDVGVGQQAVGEVAADEPGAADDEEPLAHDAPPG